MGYKCTQCRKTEGIGEYYSNGKENVKCIDKRSKLYGKVVGPNQERCYYFGYKKGAWYVTTAIVELLGLDHNVLLTVSTLREKLEGSAEGLKLLKKYDLVGPIIAGSITCNKDIEKAEALYNCYIAPCEYYINNGEDEKAIVVYVKMLNDLIDHFQTHDYIISDMHDVYQRLDKEVDCKNQFNRTK